MLDQLDTQKLISHRLYRQHVVHLQNDYTQQIHMIRDLSRLGRPLERTIIVDNLKENFCWQKDNGIEIKAWYSDTSDCELEKLIPVLQRAA